jgi:hypothetical protein
LAELHFAWSNSSFHNMKTGNRPIRRQVRRWISLVIALVFAIAAMPGSMAMPAPKPVPHHAMMAMDGAHGDCCGEPVKAPKSQDDPCKSMSVCFGMLACYGMAAVHPAAVVMATADIAAPPMIRHQSVSGLSIPPDDPPPIAA